MIKKYTNGAWAELGKYRKYSTENYDVSTFPASMLTTGNDFEDYRIYGASGGVGEKTVNLFDKDSDDVEVSKSMNSNGTTESSAYFDLYTIPIETRKKYSLIGNENSSNREYNCFLNSNGALVSNFKTSYSGNIQTFTAPLGSVVLKLNVLKGRKNSVMLVEGSVAPASYIPYGYELDITTSKGTTEVTIPIYIGSTPLEQGEYVDYGEQKVYKYVGGVLTPTDPPVALPAIPTLDGTTVIDFNNTTKPDRMTAEDTGWFGYKPKIYTNGQWVDMT